MSRHERITANALGQTLDHFAGIGFGGIGYVCRRDRAILAKLIDAGAPIADWRLDPRVADIVIPDALPRIREFDLLGNIKLDIYGGEAAEALRGIRNEYARRLTDFLFTDKPPFAPFSPEMTLAAHIVRYMPSVEEFVDYGFRLDGVDESEAA